jgi:glucose-1-phosphate adenylyltransferase
MDERDTRLVRTVAMILAGGEGSRLSVLSEKRAKPAVPFGGIYRIIDFTMSNVMHSEVPVVGICTQYKPYSLADHVSTGEAWGFARRGRMARVLPPYKGEVDSDWYAGTADAIYQNLEFLARFHPNLVLVLSGDHVYRMDYRPMIVFHLECKAALTIACQEVPLEEVSRFGIAETDARSRIIGFQEKPKESPRSNLANLGIYVFDTAILADRLRADAHDKKSTHDFGRDVIPSMIASDPCYAYPFSGYWRDVGTYHSYWQAHMDLLDPRSGLEINRWEVCTAAKSLGEGTLVPARIRPTGRVEPQCPLAGRACGGGRSGRGVGIAP